MGCHMKYFAYQSYICIYSMHIHTNQVKCNYLIILEACIYDEGVLSEVFMSGRSLCPDGVMYGGGFVRGGFVCGGFVRGGFVRGGFVQRGFCPEGVLSRILPEVVILAFIPRQSLDVFVCQLCYLYTRHVFSH